MTKRNKRNKSNIISEMSVVPYIDVMMVLLVIFMITAPLLQSSININLPDTSSKNDTVDTTSEPLIISVDKDGNYYFNNDEKKFDLKSIAIEVIAYKRLKSDKNIKVYIRGDKNSKYENIIRVMDLLKRNNLNNIGLITNLNN